MNGRRGLLITVEGIREREKQVRMLTRFADHCNVPCISIALINSSHRSTLEEILSYLERGVNILCSGYVISMTKVNTRSKAKVHNEWPTPDILVYLKDTVHDMACRMIRVSKDDVVDTDSAEYLAEYSACSNRWEKYLEEYERAISNTQAEKNLTYSLTEGSRRIHSQIVSEITISAKAR